MSEDAMAYQHPYLSAAHWRGCEPASLLCYVIPQKPQSGAEGLEDAQRAAGLQPTSGGRGNCSLVSLKDGRSAHSLRMDAHPNKE